MGGRESGWRVRPECCEGRRKPLATWSSGDNPSRGAAPLMAPVVCAQWQRCGPPCTGPLSAGFCAGASAAVIAYDLPESPSHASGTTCSERQKAKTKLNKAAIQRLRGLFIGHMTPKLAAE
jgi:hypothetical protein